ncbi:MAG: hypothetical protein GX962_04895, partial [Epulopiscium sp.]|nr:hypothetical protein [Candidatus Epulonipiscium sp.]
MEQDFKSFRRDILKATNRNISGMILEYEEAMNEIRDYLQEKISGELSDEIKIKEEKEIVKDKEY